MHCKTTFALLAAAGLTSATTPSSINHPECLHTRGRELAAAASCGDDGSIAYCLSQISLSISAESLVPEVEECFLNAGCSTSESPVEAFWALRRCEKPPSGSDLRRHAAAIAVPRDPAGITFAARQAATPPPAATTDPNASPSPCFTMTDVPFTSCPVQSTGPDAGKTLRKGCVPTTQPSPVCVEGLICRSDNQGNPSCMRKQSSLGTAGTIIAIFFATAIAFAVFGVCFMCCRERREQKRLERQAEAASIAREAKNNAMLAAKKPSAAALARDNAEADVGQPLMGSVNTGYSGGQADSHPALPPLPQQYGGAASVQQEYGVPQPYGGAAGQGQETGRNPFADVHEGHPALR
ncbi:hypothetical protein V8F20_003862 [Naviculisporaceae sp. PSN 640]